MIRRTAEAIWNGNLKEGHGSLRLGEQEQRLDYSFGSRFEQGEGSNPEELIAAALAGCFSMALAHRLAEAGFKPERVQTTARTHLQHGAQGFEIPQIDLTTEAFVPGIDEATFSEHAQDARHNCPVAKLLNAEITLDARLHADETEAPAAAKSKTGSAPRQRGAARSTRAPSRPQSTKPRTTTPRRGKTGVPQVDPDEVARKQAELEELPRSEADQPDTQELPEVADLPEHEQREE